MSRRNAREFCAVAFVGVANSLVLGGRRRGWYELLAECVVISCASVPLFAFGEVEEVVGKGTLRDLL